jgi:hypothetical protein
LRSEGALRCKHPGYGVFRTRERRAERITDRLENVPVMLRDRCPHQRIMTADCLLHRRPIALPAYRATLDVGEREGHRAARQRAQGNGPRGIRDRVHAGTFAREHRLTATIPADANASGRCSIFADTNFAMESIDTAMVVVLLERERDHWAGDRS